MGNALVTAAKIEEEVQKALAKSLRKEPSAIRMDASVMDDLGGTSLDFLDMTFRLEQAFGIRLAHTTILDHIEETFGEGKAIDSSGALTKDAVAVLAARLGNPAGLEVGMFSDEVAKFVTPGTLAQGVREALASLPAKCTHCGATKWESPDGAKVKCGGCGKEAAYTDGDTLAKAWLTQFAKEKGLFG
ncbi:MAG: acyl carrier protein [Planctomycetota bacterium]